MWCSSTNDRQSLNGDLWHFTGAYFDLFSREVSFVSKTIQNHSWCRLVSSYSSHFQPVIFIVRCTAQQRKHQQQQQQQQQHTTTTTPTTTTTTKQQQQQRQQKQREQKQIKDSHYRFDLIPSKQTCRQQLLIPCINLTHWGRDKMAAVSQTTLSNTFSWMNMLEFWLRFHWSLFLRV